MKIYILIAIVALLAVTDEPRSNRYADNLRDAVSRPSDQQDEFAKQEAEKLAKSQVPTPDEAEKLALGAFLKERGLDARENSRVAGLYRIGRDVRDFAKAGDLVWEV